MRMWCMRDYAAQLPQHAYSGCSVCVCARAWIKMFIDNLRCVHTFMIIIFGFCPPVRSVPFVCAVQRLDNNLSAKSCTASQQPLMRILAARVKRPHGIDGSARRTGAVQQNLTSGGGAEASSLAMQCICTDNHGKVGNVWCGFGRTQYN